MKWICNKIVFLLVLVALLSEISIAKRAIGVRTRSKSSGGSSWWNRRKTNSSPGTSSSSSSHGSHSGSDASHQNKPKPSAPVESHQVKKQTITNNHNQPPSSLSYPKQDVGWNVPKNNAQKTPIGWNVPGQQATNNRNPAWNSQSAPASPVKQTPGNTAPKQGWASGYQSPKRNEGLAKKEVSKVQQSSPNQPQPPQPGWNTGGQNAAAPNANSGWNSGYQTHGAPPAYPHQHAAPPGYNGQTSWGAPPAYPGYHSPGGYGGHGGYGHYQQPGGFNPGYGGAVGGYGGGGYGGGFGGHGGGFGSPAYYPQRKQSFFNAGTIGSVVAGMLVYNMASSLISHGLGLKRPYNVVNYYNQDPNKTVEEIKLPSNVLTLCEGDVTKMCGQGTQSICTQNGTVMCVATMAHTTPCDQGGKEALCVNTTVPCADANDPLCQNSTQKDKLQAEVNVPCMTNLTLDVNLVDKDQTQPNTKYTYCITTMAVAGPEYKTCEDLTNSNDYRSVLNKNYDWYLEIDNFRRNYSIYTNDRPMEESNGAVTMPVTVLQACTDNAKKLCPPGTLAVCTSFNEVMCIAEITDVHDCPEKNTTCVKSAIPCPEDSKEEFCQNKAAETVDIPCFANITVTGPFPKFNVAEFNGTLPDLAVTTSYTYNFNYCVVTLALPGSDFDMCITKEGKEKQAKQA